MKLTDMTIRAFTETLASDAPAPGGGSVAALCGAQGAALCAMVCRLTIGKAKYKDFEPLCRAALEKAEKIKERFIALIDEDTDAYGLVSAAFKLPKETDEEKKLRPPETQNGPINAAETPLETHRRRGPCPLPFPRWQFQPQHRQRSGHRRKLHKDGSEGSLPQCDDKHSVH